MGHRLSKIYTRTGDGGETGLGDGRRVAKTDLRIEAIGAVDETNSALGVVLAHAIPADVQMTLQRVQNELFDLGAELSMPEYSAIGASHIAALERDLDRHNEPLPPLREFILPGGSAAAAHCHVARAVCRRAERRTWALAQQEALSDRLPTYLNRLSDLLFVAARRIARHDGGQEVLWQSERLRSDGPTE